MAETKRPSAASIIFAPVASDKIFAPMEPTGPGDPDFAGTDAERDEEELTRRELQEVCLVLLEHLHVKARLWREH